MPLLTGVNEIAPVQDEKDKIAKNDEEGYRSYEECDSDDLYGGLDCSDDEDAENKRKARKDKRAQDKDRRKANQYKQEIDTNIFKIGFEELATKEVGQVDGKMPKCSKCEAYLSVHTQVEKDGDKMKWKCPFCDAQNTVDAKDLFQPDEEEIEIVLEAGKPKVQAVTKDGKLESDEISVVFCVDISGSMSMGKPTRLSCVKEAMINQINHMHDNNNKRKIGVVTFEEQV